MRRRCRRSDDGAACGARRGAPAQSRWPTWSALRWLWSVQRCSPHWSSCSAPRRQPAWWCSSKSWSWSWSWPGRRLHSRTRTLRRRAPSRRAASVAASRSSRLSLAHRADRAPRRRVQPENAAGRAIGSPGSARSWIADLLLRPRDMCRAWAGLTLPTTRTGQQPRPLRCPIQRSRRSGRVGDPPDVQPSASRGAAVQAGRSAVVHLDGRADLDPLHDRQRVGDPNA